jgi:hypothetical protein
MKAVNVHISSDVFLGFLLQLAILLSSAGFAWDFEQRVEFSMQQHPKSNFPMFPTLLHLFDVCRQHHYQRGCHTQLQNSLPFNDSSLMLTTPDHQPDFDTTAYLVDIDESEWHDALDFYAVTAHKCWHCG